MNWEQVRGQWKQLKGKIKMKWGKLTDDDLDSSQDRKMCWSAKFRNAMD